VVLNNGSDGPTSHMGLFGGWVALERGWHAMTFDGPGQQAALFLQGMPFRPDWEAVLTPVVDAMVARPDVDPGRLAVIGVSQAGYWVPRALAFEHRFAAAVADPGVVDVTSSSGRASPRRSTTCSRGPRSWSGSAPPRAPAATASRWGWPSATPGCSTGSAATWWRSGRRCRHVP
jgi:hypothetical protein